MANSYQQNSNNQQDKPNYIRTKCTTLFNNKTGAMQLGYATAGFGRAYATLSIAAVFNDMRGRTPKKGEQTYDYDNAIYMSLSAEDCQVLHNVLLHYKAKEILDMEISFHGSHFRIIDGSATEEDDMKDGVIIYVGKADNNSKEVSYTHSFYFENITLQGFNSTASDAEAINFTVNPSFETFCQFVSEMCRVLVSPIDHKPNRGDGASSGPNTSGTSTPRAPSRRGANTAQSWANSGNNTPKQEAAPEYNEDEANDLPF